MLNDFFDLFFCETAHRHQSIWLDHRQVVVTEESFFHQAFGHFDLDPLQGIEALHGPIDRFRQFFLGHDLNVPARKLTCESNVLTAPADGKRQLIFTHKHNCPTQHFAEDHLFDFGRLQRVGDEHFQIVVPADDVYAFATQFIDDVLDAVPAHADAGTHAVDTLVRTTDGDF